MNRVGTCWMLLTLVGLPGGIAFAAPIGGTLLERRDVGLVPTLAEVLKKAGWEPAPELTGNRHVGDLYRIVGARHVFQADSCIAAPPRRSAYTESELVMSISAGVRLDLGAASVSGGAGLVQKVKFSTPEHVQLPALAVALAPDCEKAIELAVGPEKVLSDWYVVTEVLSAMVTETTCGRVDATGRFVGLGAVGTEYAAACSQRSMEPVVIAFQRVPLSEVYGRARLDAARLVTGARTVPAESGTLTVVEPERTEQEDDDPPEVTPVPAPRETAVLILNDGYLSRFDPLTGRSVPIVTHSALTFGSSYAGSASWGGHSGSAFFVPEQNALVAFGRRGLVWVNLTTNRAEEVSGASEPVLWAAPLSSTVVAYLRRTQADCRLNLYSSESGKSVPLAGGATCPHVSAGGRWLAYADPSGVRVMDADDASELLSGSAPTRVLTVLAENEFDPDLVDVSVSPTGPQAVVAFGTPGTASHPERHALFLKSVQLDTGGTSRNIRVTTMDNPVITGLSWRNGAPEVRIGVADTDFGESTWALDGERLVTPQPLRDPPWPSGSPMGEIVVKSVQGRSELFLRSSAGDRQISDLRGELDRQQYSFSAGNCVPASGIAWRWWADGRHLVAVMAYARCGEGGELTARTVLIDAGSPSLSQVAFATSAKPTASDPGTGSVESAADAAWVSWAALGQWLPDEAAFLAADGTVYRRDAERLSTRVPHEWVGWR